jgi:hypothetical protein
MQNYRIWCIWKIRNINWPGLACMPGQDRPGQARTGQARTGQARLGCRTGLWFSAWPAGALDQVRPGGRPGQARLEKNGLLAALIQIILKLKRKHYSYVFVVLNTYKSNFLVRYLPCITQKQGYLWLRFFSLLCQ